MVEYPERLGSVFNASAFAAMRWCSRVRNQDRSDCASEHIFYSLPYHSPPVLSDVALPYQWYVRGETANTFDRVSNSKVIEVLWRALSCLGVTRPC